MSNGAKTDLRGAEVGASYRCISLHWGGAVADVERSQGLCCSQSSGMLPSVASSTRAKAKGQHSGGFPKPKSFCSQAATFALPLGYRGTLAGSPRSPRSPRSRRRQRAVQTFTEAWAAFVVPEVTGSGPHHRKVPPDNICALWQRECDETINSLAASCRTSGMETDHGEPLPACAPE